MIEQPLSRWRDRAPLMRASAAVALFATTVLIPSPAIASGGALARDLATLFASFTLIPTLVAFGAQRIAKRRGSRARRVVGTASAWVAGLCGLACVVLAFDSNAVFLVVILVVVHAWVTWRGRRMVTSATSSGEASP